MQNWTDFPHRIIRTEMTKRGINYAALVERLARIGIIENERSLRNKVARSTFSATFMLQCMVAMDMMALDLSGYELPQPAEPFPAESPLPEEREK